MKPKCAFLKAGGYSQPYELPTSSVGNDAGIVDALSAVAPHKAGFWQTHITASITVATRTSEPFGLSLTQVEEQILKTSLPQAAEVVAQRFGVDVTRADEIREKDTDCPVDLETFCGLYSIASQGSFLDAVLIACFLAPETVYVLRVPREMPLGEVLRNIPAIAKRLDTGDLPAHLLTGPVLPLDTPCSHLTSLIHFPQDGYELGADDSWLLPFPVFNRQLSMREGSQDDFAPTPCSNCMACQRFCPAGIQPAFIYHHLEAGDHEGAKEFGLNACIQCGWCSYICPSNLPLAQTIIEGLKGGDPE